MPETQLRTPAIRVAPPQLGTARVLSGVSPNGLARSRRNTGPKPETPFRRSAELDFGFLPVATPAGMHTCYPELQLSTHAAGLIAHHLSCETLPELLQMNCRGFFGLLFSYPFGLFIPRVLDT